jgi:hypothetical protein
MIEKEFIPYELALELKQLGFNENCIATYDEDRDFELQDFEQNYDTFPPHIISSPTYSQAFRWFREKHQLIHYISWVYKKTYDGVDWFFKIKGINMANNNVVPHDETRFGTYEEAELNCLKKLIEIANEQQ